MSRMVSVRLDESVVRAVEAVRDPTLYPSQSDFIREAIRRLVRDERRRRVAAEVDRLVQDPEDLAVARELAEGNAGDLAERLARAEPGEV